jgi:hypothetical protein
MSAGDSRSPPRSDDAASGRRSSTRIAAHVVLLFALLSQVRDVITCCECPTCREAEAISEATRLRALSR